MPSVLPADVTNPSALSRGAPLALRGTMVGPRTFRPRSRTGSRSISFFNDGPALPLPAALTTAMVKSDGFVDATKVGYEDWVRLAPATDAKARPPINAM